MEEGSRILQGAREAMAIARDEVPRQDYAVHIPAMVDVRSIRKKLQMTQTDFARTFGFKLATLRHWEQQTRTPEGPTRAYLLVIDREPDVVRRVLLEPAQDCR